MILQIFKIIIIFVLDCFRNETGFSDFSTSISNVGSILECQDICQESPSCDFVTLHKQKCYLVQRSEVLYLVEKEGFISAPKYCPFSITFDP